MNFCIQEHTNVIKCFFSIVRTYIFHQIQVVLIVITFQKLWCFMIHGTYFLDSVIWISSTTLLIIAWFSCFLWNLFQGKVLLQRSLVCWVVAYLIQNSPKTLHSSKKFPAPWIIQVFDLLFEWSTYCLQRLPSLPSFVGWVFYEVYSPILFLLSPVRLDYSWAVFIRKCYHIFINNLGNSHTLKNLYGLFKRTRLAIKPWRYAFIYQLFGIIFKEISFSSVTPILSVMVAPGKESKYSFKSIKRAAYCLTFKLCGFFIHRHIARFWFDSEFAGEIYQVKPLSR